MEEKPIVGFNNPDERDDYIKHTIANLAKCGGKSHKWFPHEIAVRRESIYYWLGQGKSKMALRSFLGERWGVSGPTIEKYVRDAVKALLEEAKESQEEFRKKMIEKLERLADDAIRHGDRKSALAAYEQISKLNGAYTNKVEASLNTDIKFKFGE